MEPIAGSPVLESALVLTERLLPVYFTSLRDELAKRQSRVGDSLRDFFDTLGLRLRLASEARREKNVFLALDFNVFSYIDPDESRLSDLIAELLSPDGKHGQGDTFLQLFIDQLDIDINRPPKAWPKVRREALVTYPPKSYGFIDIVIEFGSYGIGIENKPWAGEQKDQMARYRNHMEHAYPNGFCLVFLSDGRHPETLTTELQKTLKEAGRFRVLSYRSGIRKWLRECEKECQADKIRWLIRDFEAFLATEFEEDDLEVKTTNDPG